MILKAKFFLEDAKVSLAHFQKGLDEIKNGTFKYDGSMRNSCVCPCLLRKSFIRWAICSTSS